jgi:hypothetical protein
MNGAGLLMNRCFILMKSTRVLPGDDDNDTRKINAREFTSRVGQILMNEFSQTKFSLPLLG